MPAALLWFRRDLRLADNAALRSLLDANCTPVPVYIHEERAGEWPLGEASAWWLHHSLAALRDSLRARGSELLIFKGDAQTILPELAQQTASGRVAWNRCYEPAAVERDGQTRGALEKQGCELSIHTSALLREPWEHLKRDQTPYRVFTPFWKALYDLGPARQTIAAPRSLPAPDIRGVSGRVSVEALRLLPAVGWDQAFYGCWQPGEDGAWQTLQNFRDSKLPDYPKHRDIPALSGTSQLSPHLHFGEISPVQVWQTLLNDAATTRDSGMLSATESFLRELGWREFSYHLLHHFPATASLPLDTRFRAFPWRKNYTGHLRRWQRGKTGIPLVDAGMRELWATGYMHNRVRMVAASFLTKNLLIPWQEGARWFWNTLVDADLASNTMGWQWTAGCGADAAPYFRVFNPVLQGEKFDPDGSYVRRWIPELGKLDRRHIHKPWAAEPEMLAEAGITLSDTYPQPLADLRQSRRRALDAWERIRRLDRD